MSEEKTAKRRLSADPELIAMADVTELLEPFDEAARARILNYAASRFGLGELFQVKKENGEAT